MIKNNEILSIPTAFALPARLKIYQPTTRPTKKIYQFDTVYGVCEVDGKIGQNHASLMEALLSNSSAVRKNDSIQILVDPYKVRKTLGEDSIYSYSTINNLIKDLISTTLTVRAKGADKDDFKSMGNVIARVDTVDDKRLITESSKTRSESLKKPRKMWVVTLGKIYCDLVEQDIHLHYDPKPVIMLKNGITQAVVRYLLTHKNQPNGGWLLDNAIKFVSVDSLTPQQLAKNRYLIKQDQGVEKCGFSITGDRLTLI